jgi:transcriptional regulator with XRE-family HTH domain
MTGTYTYQVIRWRLKSFMNLHGVTQYALQRESGVALNTIKAIYRGETQRPDLEVLDRIIVALSKLTKRQVSVADLLEHE